MIDSFTPDMDGAPTLGGPMMDGKGADAPKPRRRRAMNTPAALKRLRQCEEWLEVERIRQAPIRYQMAIDEDYYDNLQWSDEDAEELAARRQAALVYNKIQPAIKWLTGTEKRTRIDYKILSRKSGEDRLDEAEAKTKLMKYVDDVNKAAYARSRAFEDAMKVGVGWLECGIRADPTEELLFDRWESWRNMIYDSQHKEWDLSDARYIFRQKWLDLDIAQQLWPDYREALKSSSSYSDFAEQQDSEEWYLGQVLTERSQDGNVLNRRTFIDTSMSLFNRRARVRVYECWYREPERMKYIHDPGGDLHNKVFDANDPEHVGLATDGAVSLYDRMAMRVYCAIFVRGQMLEWKPSPYKHNQLPFTPVWANRRGRDNAPYGPVRLIRDPQDDFNKRMSKALFILSTRRIVMDEGAVEDIEELREEAARPDGIIVVNQSKKLEMVTDTDIAEHQLQYSEIDARMIQDLSGVTDELMGRKTNAVSGIAVEKRQDQGSTVTTDFFDNHRLAVQLHGQKKLSLIGQFYSEEKEIRINGAPTNAAFITINKVVQDEQTGEVRILNDITRTEADFIVDETDYRATQRQALMESLMEVASKMPPELALRLFPDILEMSDVPGLEPLANSIREMTGQDPPDKRLTPQEIQAREQAQQAQQQYQQAMKMAQLQEIQGKAALSMAKATEAKAKAQAMLTESQQGDGGAGDVAMQAMKLDFERRLMEKVRIYDRMLFELQKQLQEGQERITVARLTAGTQLQIARENNATKVQVEAMKDRTQEETLGIKTEIADLDQELAELGRMKQDKPTPVDQARQMISDHVEKTQQADQQSKLDDRLGGIEDTLDAKQDKPTPQEEAKAIADDRSAKLAKDKEAFQQQRKEASTNDRIKKVGERAQAAASAAKQAATTSAAPSTPSAGGALKIETPGGIKVHIPTDASGAITKGARAKKAKKK